MMNHKISTDGSKANSLYDMPKTTVNFNEFSWQVAPGETALAFYSAKNPTDKPIIGISTYNILPYQAAQYFNKIQVRTNYVQR